jgi:DNA-binding PadR family transcriptional regulator
VPSSKSLTPLALAALEVLHEGPRHPYEIHQTLRDRKADRLVKLSAGTLYHTIERLDRDGFVQVVETSREGRRPERTTYRLTQAGRDVFAERLRDMLANVVDEHPTFAVAIEFMHTLDEQDALRQLRVRMVDLEARIAGTEVACRHLRDTGLHPLHWPNLRLQLALLRAELDWLRDLVGQLERGELDWPRDTGAGAPKATELRLVGDEHTEKTPRGETG